MSRCDGMFLICFVVLGVLWIRSGIAYSFYLVSLSAEVFRLEIESCEVFHCQSQSKMLSCTRVWLKKKTEYYSFYLSHIAQRLQRSRLASARGPPIDSAPLRFRRIRDNGILVRCQLFLGEAWNSLCVNRNIWYRPTRSANVVDSWNLTIRIGSYISDGLWLEDTTGSVKQYSVIFAQDIVARD